MSKRAKVQIGDTFGRLTVIERVGTHIFPNGSTTPIWKCKCNCGNEYEVISASLVDGNTRSCGCLQKESRIKHNHYSCKLYSVWASMKNRCNNPNDSRYKNYGGRGIEVCESWRNNFECFYEWAIAHGYKEGLTIDRIDVNGNYCPENCRWNTIQEQQFNKTNNRRFEYDGRNLTLIEWAEILGINARTLASRYYTRKWTIEKTLSTPVDKKCRNKNAK